MKPFISLIFILNLLNAAANVPDSLYEFSLKLKADTERVNLFYKEGFENRAVNPQYSFDCATLALKFAQQAAFPFYLAKANSLLGVLYFRKHDFEKALAFNKTAIKLRTEINDKKGIAITETNLGNIYSELNYYSLAENAYLKALQLNNEISDAKQICNCLINLGVLNADLKNNSAAKNYFNQALLNAKQRYDYELEAICLNNLSVINIEMDQPDEAIANCLNSIKTKSLMDNEMEMADSYLNLSTAYLKKNDNKSALENLQIADSIIEKYDYTSARLNAFKIKTDYYTAEKNFEQAFKNLTAYTVLKDSLALMQKEISLNNNFNEGSVNEPLETFRFPYVYLNILIISLILIFLFVFKPNS